MFFGLSKKNIPFLVAIETVVVCVCVVVDISNTSPLNTVQSSFYSDYTYIKKAQILVIQFLVLLFPDNVLFIKKLCSTWPVVNKSLENTAINQSLIDPNTQFLLLLSCLLSLSLSLISYFYYPILRIGFEILERGGALAIIIVCIYLHGSSMQLLRRLSPTLL